MQQLNSMCEELLSLCSKSLRHLTRVTVSTQRCRDDRKKGVAINPIKSETDSKQHSPHSLRPGIVTVKAVSVSVGAVWTLIPVALHPDATAPLCGLRGKQ